MSVTWVHKRHGVEGTDDGTTQTETHQYQVKMSGAQDNAATVRVATDGTTAIPAVGSGLAGTPLKAINVNVKQQQVGDSSDPHIWDVTVEYSYSASDPPTPENPTIWDVDVSIETQEVTENIYHDAAGEALVNSAGQPFEEGVAQSFYDEKVTVGFNATSASLNTRIAALRAARGKINDSATTITVAGVAVSYAAYTLKLIDVKCNPVYGDITYWRVELIFSYRAAVDEEGNAIGWKRNILDQGKYELDGDGELVPILDANNEPITEPVYLDGEGHAVAAGGDPVFIAKTLETATSFATVLSGLGV